MSMTSLERRAVSLLAGVYALRMAGLFLILPVFAIYAAGLKGHTPLLVGLALGAYGLTQALLQIPFGMLSDRIGRKPVIAGGLLLFAAGSAIAALSTNIWGIVLGRAIQGAGAVAAAIMAMVADLTREEQRSKAMAAIGMTIGASFVLSLILGPVLDGILGVPGIFWLTALLALAAIAVVLGALPTPVRTQRSISGSARLQFARILRDGQLLRLDGGVFILHLVMVAMFTVVPQAVVEHLHLPLKQHWELYLPVLLAGFAAMVPFLIMANRPGRLRPVMAGAVAALAAAELLLMVAHQTEFGMVIGLWLFFGGFSLLEAMLPSLVSRVAPVDSKGAAIGVYSSAQFLGAFAGGVLGGGIKGLYGVSGVFAATAALLLLWLLLVVTQPALQLLASRELRVGERTPTEARKLAAALAAVPGVAEAVVVAEEGIAYLKVDTRALDAKQLEQFGVSR